MERVWGCEFKGGAHYVDATIDGRRVTAVGWGYMVRRVTTPAP
jgi:uncharacterized protein (DUF427 family)